jgi:hypothetical protein
VFPTLHVENTCELTAPVGNRFPLSDGICVHGLRVGPSRANVLLGVHVAPIQLTIDTFDMWIPMGNKAALGPGPHDLGTE